MADSRILVDHLKLEYEGPFDLNDLVKFIQRFTFERGFDRKLEKDFEMDTKTGKHVEWQISNWKKITDHVKYVCRVRMLVSNYNKVYMVKDKKKIKVGSGRVVMFFDGLIDMDYFGKWESRPAFLFIRTLFDKFIYKIYTERFEQRLTYDINHLYHEIEKYFNMYRHYKHVKVAPHFAH